MGRASRSGNTPVRDHAARSSGVPWRAMSTACMVRFKAALVVRWGGKARLPTARAIMPPPFQRGACSREPRSRRKVGPHHRPCDNRHNPAARVR